MSSWRLNKNHLFFIALFIVLPIFCISCKDKTSDTSKVSFPESRIAVLQLGTHSVIDTVVKGLQDRTTELYGSNVNVKVYNANFDIAALSMLANQMVASKPSVLVGVTTPAAGQLVGANRGIYPLVFTFVSNPEDIGYFGKGSKPNVCGLSDKVEYKKTLSMIRHIMPDAKEIGYILTRSENNAVTIHKEFSEIAPDYAFTIKTVTINNSQDVRQAAELLVKSSDLFLFGGDNQIMSVINSLIDTANAHKIPVFACDEESVKKGAAAAYSVPYYEMGRRTADYCGLILSGANPDRVPVEVFTGTKLIINTLACQSLGLDIPQLLIDNADVLVK